MGRRLALVAVLVPAVATADGTLTARGVYYKERATRVIQPMLDGLFDAGARGLVSGHFLVDAITSASASSGADNAKPFTERRYEGGLGYSYLFDGDITVGADAKYSTESDYFSRYGGVHGQIELFQKNTVLGVGAGVSLDTVSAAAAQGPSMPTLSCDKTHPAEKDCPLDTYSLFVSGSQVLSKDAVLGLSIDAATEHGFQSNPYRQAIAGDTFVPERHPTDRTREAFAGSLRYYVSRTKTTLIGAYRYYRDSWKVHAHTPEIRIIQEVGLHADASVRYRYYTQDGAFFYATRYPSSDPAMVPYVTDDPKLSTFDGHTIEAKLGILGEAFNLEGRWAGARFEGILQYVVQNNRFGNAVVAHVALTLPFEY